MYAGYGPRNYRRPDHFLYEDVCEALSHDPEVDASEVEVCVNEGVVVLRGTVDSRVMKYAAEDAVLTVTGVKDVVNQLKVTNARMRP